MPRPIKTHVFRGKKYKIVFGTHRRFNRKEDDGQCDGPNRQGKLLCVDPKLTPPRELEVWVHEALHASFWDLDEEAIDEAGKSIASLLWRLGYRKALQTKVI